MLYYSEMNYTAFLVIWNKERVEEVIYIFFSKIIRLVGS